MPLICPSLPSFLVGEVAFSPVGAAGAAPLPMLHFICFASVVPSAHWNFLVSCRAAVAVYSPISVAVLPTRVYPVPASPPVSSFPVYFSPVLATGIAMEVGLPGSGYGELGGFYWGVGVVVFFGVSPSVGIVTVNCAFGFTPAAQLAVGTEIVKL